MQTALSVGIQCDKMIYIKHDANGGWGASAPPLLPASDIERANVLMITLLLISQPHPHFSSSPKSLLLTLEAILVSPYNFHTSNANFSIISEL